MGFRHSSIVVTLCGAALCACGQQATVDQAVLRAAEAALKSDLRGYVMAQESYYLSSGQYMNAASRLSEFVEFSPTHTVRVHSVSPSMGHSAIAYHDSLPQLVCAVFLGSETAPLDDGAAVGQPTCKQFTTVLACAEGHAYPALTGYNFCPMHGLELVPEER